ncbi:MAG: IS1595 family transposase [Acidobacteriia bacterium]|nr:IS1595 family transposase [Terriglobia bacterium]
MDDMNLVELLEKFADDEKCRAYLEALRWPDGAMCTRCKSEKVYRILKRDQFVCDSCKYQFSATAGTIFHDSHLPLWKWFLATYFMAESKKGMSANQLKRTLAVSYKTAWYLCHRIRKAMQEANPRPLKGTIELDETWIGGKCHWKNRTYLRNKTMALDAIERGGPIRMKAEKRGKNPSQKMIHQWIAKTAASNAEKLYTNEHAAYFRIHDHNIKHESMNHKEEEYVRGDVHTNSIENAGSLFKRSIVDSYHKVSEKHLDAYLDEFKWRFNNRKNPYLFRDTLLKLIQSPNFKYKELTAQQTEPAA